MPSNRRRVLFTATLVRGHIAKFHIPYLKWFKEQGWETWVAAKNDYPEGNCIIPFCDHFVNIDFSRSPASKQTLVAYQQLRELFRDTRFDLVHTHTPVGSVLTRLAARPARRERQTKVIYTAHGFHFYKGAPLVNWVLWYPIERLMSRYCDAIVTINDEDYRRALGFAHCNVSCIPGVGIEKSRFDFDENQVEVRNRLALQTEDYLLLAVGDINANKNQIVLVEALQFLPEKVKLLIAGDGPYRARIEQTASDLGVSERLSLLGFRNDIPDLLNACDMFCLLSKREGLPVSLIEALMAQRPCLATRIRGVYPDILTDEHRDWLVSKTVSPHEVAAAISRNMDTDWSEHVAEALKRSKKFSLENCLSAYAALYAKLCPFILESSKDESER